MKAHEIDFTQVFDYADQRPELAIARSFVQVEGGVSELEASWDGFKDAAEFHNVSYDSATHALEDFYGILIELIELSTILQPPLDEVGRSVHPNR